MPRLLKKVQRKGPQLRKGPPSSRGYSCTLLNCMACLCVLVNVFVFSITMILNRRIGGIGGMTDATYSQLKAHADNRQEQLQQQIPVTPKKFHIVFHTDCKDPTQDWQAYVFFYHIYKSGQSGDVTHIVTGCGDQNTPRYKSLQTVHDTQIGPMGLLGLEGTRSTTTSRFHLHYAPAHPKQPEVGKLRKHMKYFNRPYGAQHWMEKQLGYSATKNTTSDDDTIIVVMDTDMVVLRPFPDAFQSATELWMRTYSQTLPPSSAKQKQVWKRHPICQHEKYATTWWENLDSKTLPATVAAGITLLQSLQVVEVDHHFAAGPPFLVTARDFYPIVQGWNEATYPLFEALDEKILREPHAPYNVAAAALKTPAQLTNSLVVANFFDDGMMLFQSVLPEENTNASAPGCRDFPQNLKPHVLQYSKRYALGDDFIIGKHYVPYKFVGNPEGCSQPLFLEPPNDIAQHTDYYMDPELLNKKVPIEEQPSVHHMAFMLCESLQAFNEAATYYKQTHCKGAANFEKTRIGDSTV